MMERAVRSATVFLCVLGSFATRNSGNQSTAKMQKLPDLYWNTSNPIFRIDNTDHIIDVNKGIQAHEYDQITIICPFYPVGTPEEELERYIVYNVEREEFETCRIRNAQPRTVAFCTEPHKVRFFTISFRSFSPMPNSLEYRPGHDYYFISTSTNTDLHRRIHGSCRSNNMRVVFKVANVTEQSKIAEDKLSSAVQEENQDEDDTNIGLNEKRHSSSNNGNHDKKFRRRHRDKHKKKIRNQDRFDAGIGNSFHKDIALNDNPNDVDENDLVIKKTKNLIKQEASTVITGGTSDRLQVSYFVCLITLLASKLLVS